MFIIQAYILRCQLFFDEAVWYMFWKIQVTAKPENDASIVYEVCLSVCS